MGNIEDLLIGFHQLVKSDGLLPRYRWDSVLEIMSACGCDAIYRRYDTQEELKREYDSARNAAANFDGVSVRRKEDTLLVYFAGGDAE